MAALTSDRRTSERLPAVREFPVKANAVIFAGALVAIDATNMAVPAATSTTLTVVGRAEARADNAGGADAAIRVRVMAGVHQFGNSSAGDAIAIKDIGKTCYAVDDQTVALTNGANTRSAAGVVFDVDAQGVWVRFS